LVVPPSVSLVSFGFGASGVGPRQVFDSMDQCLRKEAYFSLRMAILGAGKSLLEKRNDEMRGDKRRRIPFPNYQLAGSTRGQVSVEIPICFVRKRSRLNINRIPRFDPDAH
jgi:hypothetical protein